MKICFFAGLLAVAAAVPVAEPITASGAEIEARQAPKNYGKYTNYPTKYASYKDYPKSGSYGKYTKYTRAIADLIEAELRARDAEPEAEAEAELYVEATEEEE